MWQPLCHESEVAGSGDYVLLPAPHGAQFVVSNFGGLIKAWDNVCPHRGARVLDGPCGRASEHVCPYHGRRAMPERVHSYPTVIHRGWIWADVSESSIGSDMMRWLSPYMKSCVGRMDRHINAKVSVVIENALEAEHVRHVHPGTLGRLGLASLQQEFFSHGSSVELFKTRDPGKLNRLEQFFDKRALFGADYFHAYIAPYTCVSSVRGFTMSVQHYIPAADGGTDFVHRLYAPETTRDMTPFLQSVLSLNQRVFEEDAAICERVSPGFARTVPTSEMRIDHYRLAEGCARDN